MQRQNLRVILASEHPAARHFLKKAVEEETGVIVVGETESATKVLTLTNSLRPDMVVIDFCLPPCSRLG